MMRRLNNPAPRVEKSLIGLEQPSFMCDATYRMLHARLTEPLGNTSVGAFASLRIHTDNSGLRQRTVVK